MLQFLLPNITSTVDVGPLTNYLCSPACGGMHWDWDWNSSFSQGALVLRNKDHSQQTALAFYDLNGTDQPFADFFETVWITRNDGIGGNLTTDDFRIFPLAPHVSGGLMSIRTNDFVPHLTVESEAGPVVGRTDVTAFKITPGLFSALPTCNSGNEGEQGAVTDSMTNTWGATITGSGTDHVLAYCDGTNWTVAGT
jgi:hypothetical protein